MIEYLNDDFRQQFIKNNSNLTEQSNVSSQLEKNNPSEENQQDRKKEFRAKYEAKVSELKKSYEKLIEKADTQERKEALLANLNGHLDKLKDHYRQEFNDPIPKKDYAKEELLRKDKENKFRLGIEAQKYVKDFKKIGSLSIAEPKHYEPVMTKHSELSNEYLEILANGTIAVARKKPRYTRQQKHEENIYLKFNKSKRRLFWRIRNLIGFNNKIFEYLYTSKWFREGKNFFEARATIAQAVGCCVNTVTNVINYLVELGLIRRYMPSGYNMSNTIKINEALFELQYAQVVKRAFYEANYSINRVSEYETKAYIKERKHEKTCKARSHKKRDYLLMQIHEKVKQEKKKLEERRILEKLVAARIDASSIRTLIKHFNFKTIMHNLNKLLSYNPFIKIKTRGGLLYSFCQKDH